MPTIFESIVRGEIPCHKVWEDDHHLAFLDINPRVEGHTLVIPKKPWNEIFAMSADDYDALWSGRPNRRPPPRASAPGVRGWLLWSSATRCRTSTFTSCPRISSRTFPSRPSTRPHGRAWPRRPGCWPGTRRGAEPLSGLTRGAMKVRMIAGPEWRNGRRSGLKIRLGQLSEGSNPSSGTRLRSRS